MLSEHVGSEEGLFQVGSRRTRTALGWGAGPGERGGAGPLALNLGDQEFRFHSECDGKSLKGFMLGKP